MNRTKSKILRKAAFLLADKKSTLTWNGAGTRVYPKTSARRIYQRLKVEARDPSRYKYLKCMVRLHEVGLTASKAGEALRQLANAGKDTESAVVVHRGGS